MLLVGPKMPAAGASPSTCEIDDETFTPCTHDPYMERPVPIYHPCSYPGHPFREGYTEWFGWLDEPERKRRTFLIMQDAVQHRLDIGLPISVASAIRFQIDIRGLQIHDRQRTWFA